MGDAEHSPEALEAGRILFAAECRFMLGVVSLAALPPGEIPEVAFAGRSNVGKSSLINALTNRRDLARASNTPGRTRELNFFDLCGRLRLVDLPGYGYARASRKDANAWMRLTRNFLRGRANLQRVFVLIDSRHGLKDADLDVFADLDAAAVVYQVVLTKIDKIKESELDEVMTQTAAALAKRPAAHPFIRPTSSARGVGLEHLRADIATLALPPLA